MEVMYERRTLHQLAALSNKIATNHGFDKPTWENLPIKIAFVLDEIDEVQEAMDTCKTRGEIDSEFADVAIRTLAILGALWPEQWAESRITGREPRCQQTARIYDRPEVQLWPILHLYCKALGFWRQDNQRDTMISLELALLALWRLTDRLGVDLFYAIAEKMRMNESRPMLHGKKRSEA